MNEAIDVLGNARQPADICGILYGDDVSTEMAYTPLGLPTHVGYCWAVHRARQQLARQTAAQVSWLTVF